MPVHAAAQTVDDSVSVRERSRPEYDPLGLRLGGFTLNANLDLGVTSTDNVFAAEVAPQDDTIFTVAPRARLLSNWSRHAFGLEAGGQMRDHQDFSGEDSETIYLTADGRVDIGSATQVSGAARMTQDVEPRTDPDALTAGEPVEFEHTALSVSAQHDFNRFRVRGTLASSEYDYDDAGLIDQDFRDSEETSMTGRLEAELTPRLGLILEATADERDYDNNPGANSEGTTYLGGVKLNLTDLMVGEITVGYFERDYNAGASVDGVAVAGSLEWYITRLTTASFHASRSAEEDGAVVASPYVDLRYGARVDHELLRNVILTAGVDLGQREYEIIDRDDEAMSADLGVDYLMNRRVVLNLRYRHEELESTGAQRYRDYDVDKVSAGVSLRL